MNKNCLILSILILFAAAAQAGDFYKTLSPYEVTKFKKYIKEYILLATPDLTSEEFDEMQNSFYSDNEEDGLIYNLAILHNEAEIIERMLKYNPELANGIMMSGESALDLAVMANSYEVAELLIKKGANVNSVYDEQITPIVSAACTGNVRMTKLLVDNGANVNFKDYSGASVLDLALKNFDENNKIIEYLKSVGAKSAEDEETAENENKVNITENKSD